jgi:hypothetical protein
VGRGHVDVACDRENEDLERMTAMVHWMPWPSLPWTPASALGTACRVSIVRLRRSRKHRTTHISVRQASFLTVRLSSKFEFSLCLLPHSTTLRPCFHYTLCNLRLVSAQHGVHRRKAAAELAGRLRRLATRVSTCLLAMRCPRGPDGHGQITG